MRPRRRKGKHEEPQALSPGEASMVAGHALGQWLRAGHGLQPVAAPLILGPGEEAYACSPALVHQYRGAEVTYSQSSTLAFGRPAFMVGAFAINAWANSAARRRAAVVAAPQWRFCDSGPLFLTNRRLAHQGRHGWADWWFGSLRAVHTDHESLLVYLDGCPPTMLRCPMPGWWYVALHWLFSGVVPETGVPAETAQPATAFRAPMALERPGRGRELPSTGADPFAPSAG